MISIAIASLFFVLCVWFLYMAIQVFKSHKLDKETELKELKLNIKKSDVKLDLYSYVFPELLKQRYIKERNRTEKEYEKVQLALKDWFSIFAGSTNRKEFYDFPSKEVDELWHLFILFTADYREFCHTYLGQFLDHVPLDNSNSNKYANLKNLYRTYNAVKNKNDGLLFKIDDMFNIQNEYNYNFMSNLDKSYNKLPKNRTPSEARELYNYDLISYTESKAMGPVSVSSHATPSYSSSSSSSPKNSCSSSCGSGSSCSGGGCGS